MSSKAIYLGDSKERAQQRFTEGICQWGPERKAKSSRGTNHPHRTCQRGPVKKTSFRTGSRIIREWEEVGESHKGKKGSGFPKEWRNKSSGKAGRFSWGTLVRTGGKLTQDNSWDGRRTVGVSGEPRNVEKKKSHRRPDEVL